jgi:homoserine kinase
LVTVTVPASSANLGVGFDCLALALDVRLRVAVEIIDGPKSTLSVEGQGRGRLALDGSNRFVAGFAAGWRESGKGSAPAAAIHMDNQIPLGRGLGSSAAATIAGLLAAEALSEVKFRPGAVLRLATQIEGHPDNAAAAIFGGFVVVTEGHVARFEPPAGLTCVVFVPERELSTAQMRAALPGTVSHRDAVHNAGAVALLVAAIADGDFAAFSAMNDDRLHEPYRAKVYPELPEMKRAAIAAGALGAALSGAGSSILALADEPGAQHVVKAMNAAAMRLGLAGSARTVAPTARGAIVE